MNARHDRTARMEAAAKPLSQVSLTEGRGQEIAASKDALAQRSHTRVTCPNPVLIVEDDRKTASLVAIYLEREGFRTLCARDGRTGLELARKHDPSFVVLDVMLPGMDGWEVCRELRQSSDVPILMLTAREEEMDRVLGLSIGADDYVVKPFSPRELVARVKVILRRSRGIMGPARRCLRHGALCLDTEKRKVTLDGDEVSLTPSEYKLLKALMSSPGKAFSRDELLGCLYPRGEIVVDRVVDVHIGKLRQKIEQNPSKPRFVLTVWGLGYRFAEPIA